MNKFIPCSMYATNTHSFEYGLGFKNGFSFYYCFCFILHCYYCSGIFDEDNCFVCAFGCAVIVPYICIQSHPQFSVVCTLYMVALMFTTRFHTLERNEFCANTNAITPKHEKHFISHMDLVYTLLNVVEIRKKPIFFISMSHFKSNVCFVLFI